MPQRIRNGLIDYLEIMQMGGVVELPKFLQRKVAQPPGSGVATSAIEVPDVVEPPSSDAVLNYRPPALGALSSENCAASSPEMKRSEKLRLLAEEVSRCSLCTELALSRTQTVFGVGNPNAKLVFLGEAPGADEDKKGEPFVGRAGQLLNDIITKGMKLERKDVYICNVLRCRPPGNRTPLPAEAANCRPFLDATLAIVKPKFICCLGASAAQNLLETDATIGSLRGKILEYKGIKAVCTYHPAYLLRNPATKKQTWDDIQLLMREMGNLG